MPTPSATADLADVTIFEVDPDADDRGDALDCLAAVLISMATNSEHKTEE